MQQKQPNSATVLPFQHQQQSPTMQIATTAAKGRKANQKAGKTSAALARELYVGGTD